MFQKTRCRGLMVFPFRCVLLSSLCTYAFGSHAHGAAGDGVASFPVLSLLYCMPDTTVGGEGNVRTFRGYRIEEDKAISPDGLFLLSGPPGSKLVANAYGAYLQEFIMGGAAYLELNLLQEGGSFQLQAVTVGEHHYRSDLGTDFSNVYIEGFYKGELQGRSCSIDSVGDGTLYKFPLHLDTLLGKRIDQVRIYFTAGENTPLNAFNLFSFTVATQAPAY